MQVAGCDAQRAHVLQQHVRRLRQAAVDQRRPSSVVTSSAVMPSVPMYQVWSAMRTGATGCRHASGDW